MKTKLRENQRGVTLRYPTKSFNRKQADLMSYFASLCAFATLREIASQKNGLVHAKALSRKGSQSRIPNTL
jgi:hypothetical protein